MYRVYFYFIQNFSIQKGMDGLHRILVFLFFLSLGLINFGCTDSSQLQNPNSDGVEAYKLDAVGENKLLTEYPTYILTPREVRNIYVHGNNKDWEDVWTDITNDFSESFTNGIGKGSDQYAAEDGNFTTYITIAAPADPKDYTLTFHAGTNRVSSSLPCSTTIRVVATRQFDIRYCYMTGYDILNDANNVISYNASNTMVNGFEDAKTSINIQTGINGIDKASTTLMDPLHTNLKPEDLLYSWAISTIPKSGNSAARNHSTWLFSLYSNNFTMGTIYGLSPGVTITLDNGQDIEIGISTVYVDKCLTAAANVLDATQQKQFVSLMLLHELGHARSTYLGADYRYPNNLTDAPHTGGHKGNGSKSCCVRYMPLNTSTPEFGDFKSGLKNIHFCNGHLQMLFNCNFIEE